MQANPETIYYFIILLYILALPISFFIRVFPVFFAIYRWFFDNRYYP